MRMERQLLFWLGAALVLFALVALLRDILLPFVAGMVIAYFLNPVADSLERLGLGRTLSAALIVTGVGVLVVLAAFLLAPFIASQMRQLAETFPADAAKLRTGAEMWLEHVLGGRYPSLVNALDKAFEELAQSWTAFAAAIAKVVWSQGLAIVNFLSLLLITPVVVFYLLVDWHPMLERIDEWLPRDHAATIRRLANEINEAVAAFIRGQGAICFILGVFYAVGLTAIGLPYGLLIGVATGLMAFVPFVGWAVGLIVGIGVAVAHTWPDPGLPVKVFTILSAGMAIDSVLLSPKIVGRRVGLHPVWLMFSLFVFSYLFGFVGLLVAVPVAAAVGVLVRFGLEVYLGSAVFQGRDRKPLSTTGVGGGT